MSLSLSLSMTLSISLSLSLSLSLSMSLSLSRSFSVSLRLCLSLSLSLSLSLYVSWKGWIKHFPCEAKERKKEREKTNKNMPSMLCMCHTCGVWLEERNGRHFFFVLPQRANNNGQTKTAPTREMAAPFVYAVCERVKTVTEFLDVDLPNIVLFEKSTNKTQKKKLKKKTFLPPLIQNKTLCETKNNENKNPKPYVACCLFFFAERKVKLCCVCVCVCVCEVTMLCDFQYEACRRHGRKSTGKHKYF